VPWLVLGLFLFAAALLAARWFIGADPKQVAKVVRYGAVGVLGLVAAFFLFTGRLALALPLAAGALMILRRGFSFPGFGIPGGFGAAPSPGQSTEVETDWLEMRLDHDSGTMTGRVLQGRFVGRELSELDLDQLIELLAECQKQDERAAALLVTYLDRTVGPDWRERAEQASGERAGAGASTSASAGMTREEAYEILGLEPGASREEIKEAHHRLIKHLHPDQGGSDYLAGQINRAKDLLLGD